MMAMATLLTLTITEGMGIMVLPIIIMAIIRIMAIIGTVTIGEVMGFDVQGVEHPILGLPALSLN